MADGFRDHALRQAAWCRRLDAPFTAAVCEALAALARGAPLLGPRLGDWPGDPDRDAVALRLAGGLNALVMKGALPFLAELYPPAAMPAGHVLERALASALLHPDLPAWLDHPPQTNEVGRAALLWAGLLVAHAAHALPVRLFELGASAGLNLRLDRFAYRLGGVACGVQESPVRLEPAWWGAGPPAGALEIREARGVDIAPLDPTSPAGAERLLAFVWPEQEARVRRLEAAIAVARAEPRALTRGDAADFVAQRVALCDGMLTVVLHSIFATYLAPATRERLAGLVRALGEAASASRPFAWLRFEAEGATDALPTLRLRLWPGGEERLLARAHPHGDFVEWLG
jgi:hypothetical protein